MNGHFSHQRSTWGRIPGIVFMCWGQNPGPRACTLGRLHPAAPHPQERAGPGGPSQGHGYPALPGSALAASPCYLPFGDSHPRNIKCFIILFLYFGADGVCFLSQQQQQQEGVGTWRLSPSRSPGGCLCLGTQGCWREWGHGDQVQSKRVGLGQLQDSIPGEVGRTRRSDPRFQGRSLGQGPCRSCPALLNTWRGRGGQGAPD